MADPSTNSEQVDITNNARNPVHQTSTEPSDNETKNDTIPFSMKTTDASDKAFGELPLSEEDIINSSDYVFCYVDGVMHFVKLPESE